MIRPGRKKCVVIEAPKLLLIHLKRFKYVAGKSLKDTSEVGIGLKIQLAGIQYNLAGIVRHSGSKESGHYVAVIRTSQGWLEVNDDKVNPMAINDLHWCSEAYLLFYERETLPAMSTDP